MIYWGMIGRMVDEKSGIYSMLRKNNITIK